MTGKKRTRGREQRERELGTLSDAALPKGTVIKRKTERGTQWQRQSWSSTLHSCLTAKYHNASEIVMQIGKRNKLKQKIWISYQWSSMYLREVYFSTHNDASIQLFQICFWLFHTYNQITYFSHSLCVAVSGKIIQRNESSSSRGNPKISSTLKRVNLNYE